MEDRSVPAVLTAPDLYNHHAKALKSQSAALSHAPHARSSRTLDVHTHADMCRADLKEGELNTSLDDSPLMSGMEAAPGRLCKQSHEHNEININLPGTSGGNDIPDCCGITIKRSRVTCAHPSIHPSISRVMGGGDGADISCLRARGERLSKAEISPPTSSIYS